MAHTEYHHIRLKPGPAVMELHGRQSLTKRMLVFQQFMDRASDQRARTERPGDGSVGQHPDALRLGMGAARATWIWDLLWTVCFFFENMDCKGERAVALFCTDIAARGPGLSSSPFALALPILHLHLYLDQPGLLLRL